MARYRSVRVTLANETGPVPAGDLTAAFVDDLPPAVLMPESDADDVDMVESPEPGQSE